MILGAVKRLVSWLKDLFTSDSTGYIKLKDGSWVKVESEKKADPVEPDELPDEIRDNYDVSTYKLRARQARRHVLDSKTPKQIANQAVKNSYVFSDVLNDPSLVDAESEVGAVETIAESNPGWAKHADLEAITNESVDPNAGESEGDNGDGATATGEGDTADATSDASPGTAASDASGETGSNGTFGADTPGVAQASVDTSTGEVSVSTNAGTSANSGTSANAGTGDGGSGGANG